MAKERRRSNKRATTEGPPRSWSSTWSSQPAEASSPDGLQSNSHSFCSSHGSSMGPRLLTEIVSIEAL